MDYMLRTNTKEEMDQALLTAGLIYSVDIDGQSVIYSPSRVYIDHIGPITKPAITDIDGTIITPETTDSRWHTNVRVCVELTEEQITALPQVDPPPAIPYRVFA
jgi:hypothetical protein